MSLAARRRIEPGVRFWAKVDVAGAGECWEWIGARNPGGYGKLWVSYERGFVDAHRYSVELDGRDPSGAVVQHACDNPPCVNPAHLSVGSYGDNNRDTISKGRGRWSETTACKAGHPRNEENTALTPRGTRRCRVCSRRWGSEHKLRMKARAA